MLSALEAMEKDLDSEKAPSQVVFRAGSKGLNHPELMSYWWSCIHPTDRHADHYATIRSLCYHPTGLGLLHSETFNSVHVHLQYII